MICDNLKNIEKRISVACERVGRNRNDVKLIAVSKTKPIEDIKEAVSCGITDLGENKVQELKDKMEVLEQLRWHMIGHLQTNKVKYIVGKVALIHSLDSIRLAEAIEREAAKKNILVDALVQVNIANEDTKFGILPEDTELFIKNLAQYTHINVKGLMTVAPYTSNPETNRPYFKKLKKIMVDLNSKNVDNGNMNVLSMGMTGDFEVAIEEGATHVRVGTGIFGRRNYNLNRS